MNKKISPPEIAEELYEISDSESFFMELLSNEPLDACHIKKINAGGREIRYFSAWGSVVESCRFNDTKFIRGEFYDTAFKNCDFSGCDMTEATFKRCVFSNCKGVGVNLSRGSMMDTEFIGCVMNYANFSLCSFNYVGFSHSNFKNADMTGCRLKNTLFEETVLQEVNFNKTALEGIDLTTCDIEGITVSERFSELKGAVVTSYQASCLAGLLGLVIE